jgi:hypothetical protein
VRVFENWALRMFGPKRDDVTRGWRKLHNFYSSPSVIRMTESRRRWAGHVARMGTKLNACRILVGKPEGKRQLERPRPKWVDNNKMDLRKTGWGGMHWIDLAQHRDQFQALVNMVLILKVLGSFRVAAQLAASQEGLSAIMLVS